MAICKQCGKKFHACSNCYLDHTWEYEYCCEQHWMKSEEFKAVKDAYINLFGSLTPDQHIWVGIVINHDDEYWQFYEKWKKEFFNNFNEIK